MAVEEEEEGAKVSASDIEFPALWVLVAVESECAGICDDSSRCVLGTTKVSESVDSVEASESISSWVVVSELWSHVSSFTGELFPGEAASPEVDASAGRHVLGIPSRHTSHVSGRIG